MMCLDQMQVSRYNEACAVCFVLTEISDQHLFVHVQAHLKQKQRLSKRMLHRAILHGAVAGLRSKSRLRWKTASSNSTALQ